MKLTPNRAYIVGLILVAGMTLHAQSIDQSKIDQESALSASRAIKQGQPFAESLDRMTGRMVKQTLAFMISSSGSANLCTKVQSWMVRGTDQDGDTFIGVRCSNRKEYQVIVPKSPNAKPLVADCARITARAGCWGPL